MRFYVYLLLPRRGGELSIPPIELHYFDPRAKRYQTATTTGINVTVTGDPEKIGAERPDLKENVLAPKIRPLRNVHHVASRIGERLPRGRALPYLLGAP